MKEKNIVKYALKRQVSGTAVADKPRYMAKIASPKVVGPDDFAILLGRQMQQSTALARFALSSVEDLIADLLSQGYCVNLDLAKFRPALKPASFDTIDADLSSATVEGSVIPTRRLKTMLKETVAAENEIAIPHIVTYEMVGDGCWRPGDIIPGRKVIFNVHGLEVNEANEDEGIFLEDMSGNVVSKARINKQTHGYFDFVFEGDIKVGGNYRVCYCTRLGKGREYALIKQYYSQKIRILDEPPPPTPPKKARR